MTRQRVRVHTVVALLAGTLVLTACSSGHGLPSGPQTDVAAVSIDPCDLTNPDEVGSVFAATVVQAKGISRDCEYTLTGGKIDTVYVSYYGPAIAWDATRREYESTYGALHDLDSPGDAAFTPESSGVEQIVVRSENVVYGVGLARTQVFDDDGASRVHLLAGRISGRIQAGTVGGATSFT